METKGGREKRKDGKVGTGVLVWSDGTPFLLLSPSSWYACYSA